ncbi:2-dehydropantoate 2-reductase [Niallia taxi]|uniref:2-dehydropantoate 2-reductase n=1 Tax=Niallia taxi TaxID=2499688 RepID=UPI0021A804B5|nr:2-dehydropantoate 2-reductase [Niallia taxi]MCT2344183.1 2-dehydropantoate 2-reductase [Niallia taxi]
MKISIIGGGAIGLLCAAYLAPKHKVTVYVRTDRQRDLLREKGLTISLRDKMEKQYVSVELFENWDGSGDLTIITVKQYQLEPVMKQVKKLSNGIRALLFLQNGMGHLQAIEELTVEKLYVGIVEHGVMKLDGASIRHAGVGSIQIASLPFCGKNRPSRIGERLTENSIPNFELHMQTDPMWMMQKKLVVNCLVNTLTTILEINNGKLIENVHYERLLVPFMEEITEILEWNNDQKAVVKQYVWKVIKQTSANKSSMLKDLEAGRKTEIDAILGYVLALATKKDKHAPLSAAFYEMLKGKEQEREGGI